MLINILSFIKALTLDFLIGDTEMKHWMFFEQKLFIQI